MTHEQAENHVPAPLPFGAKLVRAFDLLAGGGLLFLFAGMMILAGPSTTGRFGPLDLLGFTLLFIAPGALLLAGLSLLRQRGAAAWRWATSAQAVASGGFWGLAALMVHGAATDPQGGGPSFVMGLFALFLGGVGLMTMLGLEYLLVPRVRRSLVADGI
jgi:hypothetical protein